MKNSTKFHLQHLLFAAALALATIGGIAYWSLTTPKQSSAPAAASSGPWHRNGQGGRYLLQMHQGRPLPAGARLMGTVLSDANCRPDAQGLSHCHNDIELSDGRKITVIDTHQMNRNRCLKPGDRISVRGVNSHWVVGTLAEK